MPDFTLTEGQERHLLINLSALHREATLLIERLEADGAGPSEWRRQVIDLLESVILDLERLSAETGIPLRQQQVPLEREIAAWASIWWSRILDCRPSALKGYGTVDENVAEILTPSVKRIAETLLRIGREGG